MTTLARCAVLCACLMLSVVPARADDLGGNPYLYAAAILWAEARNAPQRIEGRCYSACTMWIGYRGTCFAPGTVLGFHSVRLRGIGRASSLNSVLEDHYPPRVRAWFRANAAASTRIVRLPVETVVGWGEARLCPADPTTFGVLR